MSSKKTRSKDNSDIIDIYSEPNIIIKHLEPSNIHELRLEIQGKSIDCSIINAIRRSIYLYIPIYGFHRSNIHIEAERSRNMYNFDMIYNLIETLSIFDIPNYFDLENPETFLTNEIMRNLFGKFIQDKHRFDDESNTNQEIDDSKKKLFKIELSLNIKNNTGSDRFVTSHDAILRVDGIVSNSYTKREPICILVLKPSEEISLRAEANLGIAKMYASYEATTNVTYDEIDKNKYVLWYETLEQLDKNTIFLKSCTIIVKKLQNLKNFISNNYQENQDPKKEIVIELYGEDHTLGNLLEKVLQKCEFIEKAGYNMPHPFIDKIVVSYKLYPDSTMNPIKVFIDCIEYLINVFELITHHAGKK
ncbi:DNA directed RNA polymerase subunit [Megavirus baoshan]|uniref:Putative DNA directed RNA polymerase subunit n=1 Tax=Megavirus baoshan TaxID=2496520 RepID=A0A3S8UXL2_9VIRU|nr:DNA directed RNA polymerase subunit [Megavirus baoshan]AZL89438.1 DNA directed RNA polymerase subunit [Megavirus baoshan]